MLQSLIEIVYILANCGDPGECGISPVSTLFGKVPIKGFPVYKGSNAPDKIYRPFDEHRAIPQMSR